MFTLLIRLYNLKVIKSHLKFMKHTKIFALIKLIILSAYKIEKKIEPKFIFKLRLIIFKIRYASILNNQQFFSEAEKSKNIFYVTSSKPLIRWVKGDGLDDGVTRSAIAQATRLFGNEADYCITTNNIKPERVRDILSWASQPVEWIPVSAKDNKPLAQILWQAGCREKNFGYWWKWFPTRVRPSAPEWILDGDMVITAKPKWFHLWKIGKDTLRVSQDSTVTTKTHAYGEYAKQALNSFKLYSGIISLPPKLFFDKHMINFLKKYPLKKNHDGSMNMSEQGVVAAVFSKIGCIPIPLSEFPYAHAETIKCNYGKKKNTKNIWGYHFIRSFIRKSKTFFSLVEKQKIYWVSNRIGPIEKFSWLRNHGQNGNEGYSMHPFFVQKTYEIAKKFKNKDVLEIGTSRGYLAAIMNDIGCRVTTIDNMDRGALLNLQNLRIKIIHNDAIRFLKSSTKQYDFIIVDLHGNYKKLWLELFSLIQNSLKYRGTFIFYNSHISDKSERARENGIQHLVSQKLLNRFTLKNYKTPWPGMLIGIYDN